MGIFRRKKTEYDKDGKKIPKLSADDIIAKNAEELKKETLESTLEESAKENSVSRNIVLGGGTLVGDFSAPEVGVKGAGAGLGRGLGTGRSGRFDYGEVDRVLKEIAERDDSLDVEADGYIDPSKLSKEDRASLRSAEGDTIDIYPHLMALRPNECYVFNSDYMVIDNRRVQSVMTFVHDDAAVDNFDPFWGMRRIPQGLDKMGVTSVLIEQVEKMSSDWIDSAIKKSDKMLRLDEREQEEGGTNSTKYQSRKRQEDQAVVTAEIHNGAAYLHVQARLIVSAPSVEVLDEALEQIASDYVEVFGNNLRLAAYQGEQRREMSTLLALNKNKRGRGMDFTSTEFAGSYHLVTNGLSDDAGDFVGTMDGDINNSVVLLDVDNWSGHIVVADNQLNGPLGVKDNPARYSDMWGSKIAMAALLNNHRVVHIVFNDADLSRLGPNFDSMTTYIDMKSGEVNMFEVFGEPENNLQLFQMQITKLKLMVRLAYEGKNSNLDVMFGKFQDILHDFYKGKNMWRDNATDNMDKIRLAGLYHEEYPRLHDFMMYLDTEVEKFESGGENKLILEALTLLQTVIKNMLDVNGDLFDQLTDSRIDNVVSARRVVYDFRGLDRRSSGLAMAQLVNVIGYAVGSLREGDVLLIHGADALKDYDMQEYVTRQLAYLSKTGGRVCWLYDSPQAMLEEADFNKFQIAYYTLLSPMDADTLSMYEARINQAVPRDLKRLIVGASRGDGSRRGYGNAYCYLRRGVQNVFFKVDLPLGLSSKASRAAVEARNRIDSVNRPASAATGLDVEDNLAENIRKDAASKNLDEQMKKDGPIAAGARKDAEKAAEKKSEAIKDPSKDGGFAAYKESLGSDDFSGESDKNVTEGTGEEKSDDGGSDFLGDGWSRIK